MTESYRTYTFSLGENPERQYKGHRCSVSQGQAFAFDIINKWKMFFISFVADAQKQAASKNLTEEETAALELQFILKLCVDLDVKELMEQGEKIVCNQATHVAASEGNAPQSFALSSQKHFDEWFEKYPEDLMQVYAYAVWFNVKPFISSFMQKWTEIMAGMEEKTSQTDMLTEPEPTS